MADQDVIQGQGLLITGSDTEVGKTLVTSALLAHWLQYQDPQGIAVIKPVQTGQGDGEWYQQMFPDLTQAPEQINPLRFQAPLAPPLAAAQEGRTMDLGPVWDTLHHLLNHYPWVLVEALGGLGSPVTKEWTVADLAAAWHLPIVIVVPIKLGAIGQAVATVALARQCQLTVRGIILNCPTPTAGEHQQDWAPVGLMASLTQVPVLGTLPWIADSRDRTQLAIAASDLDLESLWPCP